MEISKRRQDAINKMIGKRFGRWTVLSFVENRGYNLYYLCKCDCGSTKVISGGSLKYGKSKSCGCYRAEFASKNSNKTDKMIGKRFGKLTVLEATDERQQGLIKYLCKCDCGNTTIISGRSLKRKHNPSCGCADLDINDIIGKKFGRLTVLSVAGRGSVIKYNCRCDCGNETVVHRSGLIHGTTKSCGCLGLELAMTALNDYNNSVLKDDTNLDRLNTTLHSNNKSGRKGVYWNSREGKWIAFIGFQGRSIRLGRFNNFDDAVKARELAEEELWAPTLNKYGRTLE